MFNRRLWCLGLKDNIHGILASYAGKMNDFNVAYSYKNIRIKVNGIKFPSKKEAERYKELLLLKQAGEIKRILLQTRWELPHGVKYYSDFFIKWKDGSETVEDVKGVKTAIYKMKKKQVEAEHGIEIIEV